MRRTRSNKQRCSYRGFGHRRPARCSGCHVRQRSYISVVSACMAKLQVAGGKIYLMPRDGLPMGPTYQFAEAVRADRRKSSHSCLNIFTRRIQVVRPTSEISDRCKHLVRLIPRRSHITPVRNGRAVDDVVPPLTLPHSIILSVLMNR